MSQTAAPRIGGGEVSTYVWGRADLYGRGWVARQQNLIPLIGGLYRRPGTKVLRCGAMDEHTYGAPCVLMSMAPYAATHGGTVGLHGGGLSIYYPYDPPPAYLVGRTDMELPGFYEGDYHCPLALAPTNTQAVDHASVGMPSISGGILFDSRMDFPADYGGSNYYCEPGYVQVGVPSVSGGELFNSLMKYPRDFGGPNYHTESSACALSVPGFVAGAYQEVLLTWTEATGQNQCNLGQPGLSTGEYIIP